ncbi:MAG TPA: alpha/beta fold hydrolase [Candidatus Elarobacter sp.]
MNPTAERIQDEVQRAIQRSLKGLDYLASPAPAVGPTPKDVLLDRGTLHLYHYRPLADEIYRIPILIVMATSNRGYILDLTAGQSFVEYLLRQGYDVYLIDWSPPVAADSGLRFTDYTQRFIPECVQLVRDDSGVDDITVLGYCMGGVLTVMYAALHPQDRITNLVCFTTPIDFSRMELFAKWSDRRYFDVDKLVDATGNVPSELIFSSFDMLRPASRIAGQIQLWENMWDEKFVKSFRAFERWSTDTLPLAGEYFRETIKELIWENRLHKNELVVGGKRVDLGAITAPLLHAMAEHDHIVPYDAAKPLIGHVGSTDKEEIVLKGGHVSLVAGPNAVKRLWPKLDSWLGVRSV